MVNLTEIQKQCHQQYRSNNTPFSDLCNISSEYPCLRTNVTQPFNVTLNRPCISLTQIGDGKIDCLAGLDERNRLQCAGQGMLGFNFQYNHSRCISYPHLCVKSNAWTTDNDEMYRSVCFNWRRSSENSTDAKCNGDLDVICLNETCIENARCNGQMECPHGEDEYRCPPPNKNQVRYRTNKESTNHLLDTILPIYPLPLPSSKGKSRSISKLSDDHLVFIREKRNRLLDNSEEISSNDYITRVYEQDDLPLKSTYEIVRDALPKGTITFKEHYLPFICNRGVAVQYYTNHTVCFCPSSSFGSQCQFHSDRIMIQTHLNLTNYPTKSDRIAMIKVLITFFFQDEIVDYDLFHVNPWREIDEVFRKRYFYFEYPRTEKYLQLKRTNRSGTQLYNVRFEAFDLYSNGTIQAIGVWKYPIYFDFLPSFRLSKILHFHPPIFSSSRSPCLNKNCGQNGICQEILNSNGSSHYCSCHSGYFGPYCESFDERCNNYCSPKSICKPEYRQMIIGHQQPLCLCPVSTFGKTCFIQSNQCQSNPCLHGGTCFLTYDVSDIRTYFCICTDGFEGDYCQTPRSIVDITILLSSNSMVQRDDVRATTVSFSYSIKKTWILPVHYQQVFDTLPSRIQLVYDYHFVPYAPGFALIKVYGSNYHSELTKHYLLYLHIGQKGINITVDLTSENHCPLIQTLWPLLSKVYSSSKFH